MNNVMRFQPCPKCGALLLSAAAICNCMVRHDDQAHTEQMPLSPAIVQPVVLQTSTTALSEGFAVTNLTKR
jgi:hypothetical protein